MKIFYVIAAALLVINLPLTAVNYTVENQGNVTNITNNADVVSYTKNKGDQQFINKLKKNYNGISDKKKLNELLAQENYIEVLNSLWTEPDAKKRLDWLEVNVNGNHPILMFELGEEYFNQNPTIQTYVNKSMPWILTAARRTYLDTICTSDASVGAAPEMLLATYQDRLLSRLLENSNQEDLEKYITNNAAQFQKNNIETLKKVLLPIVNGDGKNIPSPKWVFAHGLAPFTGGENKINAAECNALRKKEAQVFLDKITEVEKSLKQQG